MLNQATLRGWATDDGLPNPPADLTYQWNILSGPGIVNFGNANAGSTTATFSAEGNYSLRLTAFDGASSGASDVAVTVEPIPTPTPTQTPTPTPTATPTPSPSPTGRKTDFDFDGDGRADVSVYRPSQGNWYINRSRDGFYAQNFGNNTDKLAPAEVTATPPTAPAAFDPDAADLLARIDTLSDDQVDALLHELYTAEKGN